MDFPFNREFLLRKVVLATEVEKFAQLEVVISVKVNVKGFCFS